jgi:hypothetical protein
MEMVAILYCSENNKKTKIYTCLIQMQFFLNYFYLYWVEFMDELMDRVIQ